MACMCGDSQCWSCGPAQGNFRCPICHVWADTGCEHLDEDSGQIKPEFQAAAEQKIEQEREYERLYWEEYDRMEKKQDFEEDAA